MLEFSWFVCGVLYAILYCYLFSNLICEEKFKINIRIAISSIVFAFLYVGIMKFDFGISKPFLIHCILYVILLYIYKVNITKSLIGILSIFFIATFAEIIYDLFMVLVLKIELTTFLNNSIAFFVSNVVLLILDAIISKIKFVRKVISNILMWYNKNELKSLVIFVVLAMTIGIFVLYNNFASLLSNSLLWFTNLFCIGVMVFVIGFFKEKSNNNRIISEYDQLLNYVRKYEKVIDEKSKNQHEYKNQLILIKGMISKNNKKALQYIDDLYKNEKEDTNLELLKKLQYLPQGGLKGLIYYKVEEMINKDVDVYVDISSKLKQVKSKKQLNNNLQDISKILGVYIDNAIEAAMMSDKKYIIIESYLEDDYIVFSISNTYKGNVNLNKVDKEGYTTKGEGKGYGLSLVKDIISKSNYLKQERILNGIYYVQKLYIKK